MVPPEEGLDKFRDKEDEETPLPILPSCIHGITATEADIDTLRCDWIGVNKDKKPAPENAIQSDDVLPAP